MQSQRKQKLFPRMFGAGTIIGICVTTIDSNLEFQTGEKRISKKLSQK